MKKLLLALALLLPNSAFAQCNGTFPNNTVCGNVTGSANLPRATNPSAFLGAAGGTNGQQQYNNAGALGGFTQSGDVTVNTSTGVATIQPNSVSNADLITGSANTVKGTVNGSATSDLAVTSCSVAYRFTQWITGTGWSCGISPIIPSRAIAATLDLSAFTGITTQGYATAGDGGEATFVNVGAAPFRDSIVTNGSITNAGSGCADGTYRNNYPTGGTGVNFSASITVAGNVLTSVTPTNGGGNAYSVGDVLVFQDITCSNTAWTVSAVSTPRASFTDAAGNHWQYVVGAGNHINARQFGCKFDWNRSTGDAGATDDYACLQAALYFASYASPNKIQLNAAQTFASTKLVLPAGTALVSDTLLQPSSVWVDGQGPFNTFIKTPDAGLTSGAGAHVWYLCDPRPQVACFGVRVSNFGVSAFNSAANANAYVFWSNAAQQTRFMDNVAIYSGGRGCINYEVGYGGAANLNLYDIFCTINTGAGSPGINIASSVGTTIIRFLNLIVESGGAGLTGSGINARAGQLVIDGYHTEGVTNGIDVNMTVASHSIVVKNSTGGAGCNQLITLQSTNTPGNLSIENTVNNGCTNLVVNGQPAGSNRAGGVTPANGLVSFNP